jgi:hypothetical protein
MAITAELISEHIKEWELLGSELAQHELAQNSRFLRDEKGGFYWPAPWIMVMAVDPQLARFAQQFLPIEPELLAPMSDRLKELADLFELPHYEGKAKPQPLPGSEAQKAQARVAPHGRCPQCGGKMKAVELLAWEASRTRGGAVQPVPTEFSGVMCCPGCGAHVESL